MTTDWNLMKSTYFQEGGLFTKNGQVWLFWGRSQPVQRPVKKPALMVSNFLAPEFQWLEFENVTTLTSHDLRSQLKSFTSQRQWKPASRSHFDRQFDLIREGFDNQSVKKVVPYIFEVSSGGLQPEEWESMLCCLMAHHQGYGYGFWKNGQGLMGLTPEILVSQKGVNSYETMALAGTTTIENYRNQPELFLNDPKERVEHFAVVEDIKDQLKGLGELKISELQVLQTPHLAHLKTAIQLCLSSGVSLENLIKKLHPTPALGCTPRRQLSKFMSAFDQIEPRGPFGAPFGISYSQSESDVVVAIRNVIWDSSEIKVGAGCGVVPESDQEKEWLELKRKRESVKKIFGLTTNDSPVGK